MMCGNEQQIPGTWSQQGTHQPPLKVKLPLLSFPLWQLICSSLVRPPFIMRLLDRRTKHLFHHFSTQQYLLSTVQCFMQQCFSMFTSALVCGVCM